MLKIWEAESLFVFSFQKLAMRKQRLLKKDIKTAVSEAVTNSVVHGYNSRGGNCKIQVKLKNDYFYIKVEDYGVGITDIEQARQPFFTTGKSGERSGMGFTVMETFMDEVIVTNQNLGSGLVVEMVKVLEESEK